MEAVAAWCRDRGLVCRDVSAQKVGWDLEAGEGEATLRIEVKGTSRAMSAAAVELTPNEYAMLKEYRGSYRVAVVAVDAEPCEVAMFAWTAERKQWVAGERELEVNVVVSARGTVTHR
jgi:hypothetical protein